MADTPSALSEQLAQNTAEIQAQTLAMAQQMGESQAHFAATQAERRSEIDDMINGDPPGTSAAMAAGQGPHFDGQMPGPMMDAQHGPMMDGGPMMLDGQPVVMLDGQTPGLTVQQSLHDHGDGDGGGIIESLLGFDLDGGEEDGAEVGEIHNLDDAIQLAQETGQVVVIEEVIIIEPGADGHDHSGGDVSF